MLELQIGMGHAHRTQGTRVLRLVSRGHAHGGNGHVNTMQCTLMLRLVNGGHTQAGSLVRHGRTSSLCTQH
eukprot:11638953-Karenia_brevis.AAC.1